MKRITGREWALIATLIGDVVAGEWTGVIDGDPDVGNATNEEVERMLGKIHARSWAYRQRQRKLRPSAEE